MMPSESDMADISVSANSYIDTNIPAYQARYLQEQEETGRKEREVKVAGGKFYSFTKRLFDILSSGIVLHIRINKCFSSAGSS